MIPAIPTNYLLLAVAVAAFGTGWTVQGWRWDASEKKAVQAALERQAADIAKANDYSSALELELARQSKENRDLQGRMTRETRNASYRCPLPASGLSLFNSARTGKAAGQPDR
ncbi:hypothetical protein [Zavarzinella formosa]|uniref:hypothetical protein n=1 Tax=Zavarzinella formosa TaxID=360055 RepID=UPI000376EA96|nr:hypothetical protein [Zavarzinella formosa]